MMGHKICLSTEIWIIIPKLSLLPLLSGALVTMLSESSFGHEHKIYTANHPFHNFIFNSNTSNTKTIVNLQN